MKRKILYSLITMAALGLILAPLALFAVDMDDPVVQAHGVDDVYAQYGDIIAAAEPVQVAILDGLITDPSLPVIKLINPYDHPDGHTGHANNAARNAIRFAPDKTELFSCPNGASHFGGLDYAIKAAEAGAWIVNESYHRNSATMMGWTIRQLAEHGTLWSAPFARDGVCYPAYLTLPGTEIPQVVLPAFAVTSDGQLRGAYDPEIRGVAVMASAPSWAAPTLASAAVVLKLIDPDLTAERAVEIILQTAETRDFSWGKDVPWLRVDHAVELLLQDEDPEPELEPEPEPEPDPELEPEPEPDPMAGAADTFIGADFRAWTFDRTNGAKGEGLAKVFADDGQKVLWWSTRATLTIAPARDKWLTRIRTANDAPQRDPVRIGDQTLGSTEARHAWLLLPEPIHLPAEVASDINIEASGDPDTSGKRILQIEYIELSESLPDPDPGTPPQDPVIDPIVDQDPEIPGPRAITLTITWDNGHTQTVDLNHP